VNNNKFLLNSAREAFTFLWYHSISTVTWSALTHYLRGTSHVC